MFVIVLLFPLLFLACGEAELKVHDEEYERRYNEEQELRYNYRLLKAYFYHPEKIKEYEAYKGMEVDTMYKSLKDYFCGVHYEGSLEDCPSRYTRYYPPEKSDNEIGNIENTKRYYSFGFQRETEKKSGDTMIVWWVYPNSPANSAGLRKKDKLLSANEKSLIGLTSADLAAYLKNDDPFEDKTVFTVLRDGKTKILDPMQKAEVPDPTVYLDSLEGVPYIRVYTFKVSTNHPRGTYYEFNEILKEIKGAKVAIMDLRSNGGGNIWHCTAMASELVPSKNTLLLYDVEHYYDSRSGKNRVDAFPDYAGNYLCKDGVCKEAEGKDIKWIVLINKGSASCSERLLAAVKYNRPETVVIGQKSYGKGIGQIYTKTYLGGLAYITCLQTFYPNGETFHNIGIIPDPNMLAKPTDPYAIDIYDKVVEAIQGFGGLAKRSPTSVISGTLPPERLPENNMEPGAYKKIEQPLFHQWE
ncbi:MAG: hypothetical protein LBC64_04205 [Fibromonadaceae bacterium]|jgi:C-terminal peptidase prc|nr:hypothetical protein [Fibromonadaceae bacterium]